MPIGIAHLTVLEGFVEFRMLGQLQVVDGDHLIDLGPPQQRALLALLLIRRNEVVPVDAIVAALWPGEPPRTAAQTIRVYVSQLRKVLGDDEERRLLVTHANGYMLQTAPGSVDVERFEELCRGADGDADATLARLDTALSLWRGDPLPEFVYEEFAASEIRRLSEVHLGALEDRFEASLATGHTSDLVAGLEQLARENPLRERLHAQLMLALYRADRQADALAVYQKVRRQLVEELGLEPGETLRSLHTRMLQRDPDLSRAHSWPVAALREQPARRQGLVVAATLVVVVAVAAGVALAATQLGSGGSARQKPLRVAYVNADDPPKGVSPSGAVSGPVLGLRGAERDLGVKTNLLWNGQIERAAKSADLVILGATPYAEDFEKFASVARHYPKKHFVASEAITSDGPFAGLANVSGIAFDNRELGYLAGYLAGVMLKPHQTVSAVGGVAVPSVRNLIAGYRAGVLAAQPTARVLVGYTRSFTDQQRCQRMADRQIDHGAKVVFDVAGECGLGAMQAVQIRGVWGIGVDTDLSYLGSNILGSAVKRFDRQTEAVIALDVDGKLPRGGNVVLNLANDSVGLVGISDRVPDAARRELEAVAAKLRAADLSR